MMIRTVGNIEVIVSGSWPEDGPLLNCHVIARQHIIDSQIPNDTVRKIAGVISRGSPVPQIRAALSCCGSDGPIAARRKISVDSRMLQQLIDGGAITVAVDGICVQVAENDETTTMRQTTSDTLVVKQPRFVAGRNVLGPQTNFVMIASPVAVFRAVKRRRCWVCCQ